jgi:hypothetical protein
MRRLGAAVGLSGLVGRALAAGRRRVQVGNHPRLRSRATCSPN